MNESPRISLDGGCRGTLDDFARRVRARVETSIGALAALASTLVIPMSMLGRKVRRIRRDRVTAGRLDELMKRYGGRHD